METAVVHDVNQVTSTGVTEEFVTVPFPSWPYALYPQHFRAQAVVTAQLWKYPAYEVATQDDIQLTATGDVLVDVVPSQTCP